MADLVRSPANQNMLDRQIFQLSRCLGEAETEIRAKMERLLKQYAEEWKSFVDSLGSSSFVAQWALGVQ